MKKAISTICFCIISIIGYSQVWTEPVNISNMNALIQRSDFVIDHMGVFHCVWDIKLSDSHCVIYYSKSLDNGLSWSEPENISQNDTRYYTGPIIDVCNDNTLFVAFDNYESVKSNKGVLVSLITFDGDNWSEVLDLGYGFETRMEIDLNDIVYVFWFQGLPHDGVFHYRFFENGEWSEIITPYEYTAAKTFIDNIIADSMGNLHCVGQYVPISTLDFYPAYFKFNSSSQQWDSDITKLSEYPSSTSKIDVDLFSNEFPAISRSGFSLYYHDDLFDYGEMVYDTYTYYTVIVVTDTNSVYIVSVNVEGGDIKLKQHWKEYDEWTHHTLDSAVASIFTPKIFQVENSLAIVYEKSDIAGEGDVYFLRTDIQTSSNSNFFKDQSTLEIYPNPAYDKVLIHFSNENGRNTSSFTIVDLQGNTIKYFDSKLDFNGTGCVEWNGCNESGVKVPPGVYVCVLKSGVSIHMKKFIYFPYNN